MKTFLVAWFVFSALFAQFIFPPSEDMAEEELRAERPWPRMLLSVVVGFGIVYFFL